MKKGWDSEKKKKTVKRDGGDDIYGKALKNTKIYLGFVKKPPLLSGV